MSKKEEMERVKIDLKHWRMRSADILYLGVDSSTLRGRDSAIAGRAVAANPELLQYLNAAIQDLVDKVLSARIEELRLEAIAEAHATIEELAGLT